MDRPAVPLLALPLPGLEVFVVLAGTSASLELARVILGVLEVDCSVLLDGVDGTVVPDLPLRWPGV